MLFLLCVTVALGAGCTEAPVSSERAMESVAVEGGTQEEAVNTMPAIAGVMDSSDVLLPVPDAPAIAATDAAPVALVVNIVATNFAFSPSTMIAAPGQEVVVTFHNVEGTHSFVIEELGINESIRAGSVLTFVAPMTPGVYPFYCGLGSHHALGMEGTLLVK